MAGGERRHYIPHCRHHASEAREKHGSSKMDRLIRLSFVPLCCLAGAQERKERLREVKRHELRHCQHGVMHHKPAVQWIVWILMSVAGEMQNGRLGELIKDSIGRRCTVRHFICAIKVAQKINRDMRGGHGLDEFDFINSKR